ncbi:MAG: SMC-Scp complex subunit ScpB [Saccharofermentanales bacterium]
MINDDEAIKDLEYESADDLIQNAAKVADEIDGDNDEKFVLPDEYAKAAIEAILFASGDPISIDKISSVLNYDKTKTKEIIDEMTNERLYNMKNGLIIRQLGDAYTLSTKPELEFVLQRLFTPRNRPPISQAAYETLAIIAYNQPVTRSQVESVRGVSSDSIISRLIEKNLIQECGSLDAPGRPSLFETTELFLKEFGLSSVRELPPIDMMMYGTLRDIESSIAQAAGKDRDNQVTIDQIAETNSKSADDGSNTILRDVSTEIDSTEIIKISSAIFGDHDE